MARALLQGADMAALPDLLDLLYGSVRQPQQMVGALDQLARCLRADVAQAYRWLPDSGAVLASCISRAPLTSTHDAYVSHFGAIDPRRAKLVTMPSGGVLRCHDHFDGRYVSRSEFYQDFLLPNRLRWVLGGRFDLGDGSSGIVATLRGTGTAPNEAWTVHLLQRLLPHFRRAFELRMWVQDDVATGVDATALVLSWPQAAMLVDRRGQAQAFNAAWCLAEPVLPMCLVHGVVRFTDADLQARWRRSLDRASGRGLPGQLALQDLQGAPMRIELVPCRTLAAPRDASEGRAVMVLFVPGPAASSPALPEALPFKLTASEDQVLKLLLRGQSAKQIAAIRGVALTTTRTQVASLLKKAGCRSQRELIVTVARGAKPSSR